MASGGNRLARKPLPIPATAASAASRIRLRCIAVTFCQEIPVSRSLRLRVLLQPAYLIGVAGGTSDVVLR